MASLAIVLGLFFVLAWFLRRHLPKGLTQLPKEVLEPLGRAPLAGKQQMHLVKIGGKLLLVVVTPFGAETLTEITDADEVARLSALCRASGGQGPSAEFRAVLRHFEREPAEPGFLGDATGAPRTTPARGGRYA
jgi:flagellar biogenesis protein FliO